MHSFSRSALSIAISVVTYNKQLKSVKSSTQKSKFVMTSFTSFMLSSNFFHFWFRWFLESFTKAEIDHSSFFEFHFNCM